MRDLVPLRTRRIAGALVASALLILCSTPATAVSFKKGKLFGSWDTTITYGASFRLDDPDEELIGVVNGGEAFSVNGDDGNLNYGTGIWSNQLQLTSEVEVNYGNFGAFVRGTTFYDYESEKGDRERTALSDPALERVGQRTDLLDAFAWAKFRIGSQAAEVRVGQQVVSWGESTFIQNGLNVLNPVDVSRLRVAGAELRDALLPEGMVWSSFGLTDNTSLELVFQYAWSEIEIDPPGSYFSTSDFAGDGGQTVFLGFGDAGDTPDYAYPGEPDRPFLGVPRDPTRRARDGGQYGMAFRWFVPALGETEFGLYYLNYHSRLPLINGRTGTVAGAVAAGAIGATPPGAGGAADIIGATLGDLIGGGDLASSVAAGVAAAGALVPVGAAQGIAGTTAQSFLGTMDPAAASAAGATAATGFATDAYARTAAYFLAYPEDIEMYGLSFNTQLGRSGIALQGEGSFRKDAPLQVDDVELLFAALTPINPVFAGTVPGFEAGASQLGNYSTRFETPIQGFIERDVMQFQTTATKVFGPSLGADQTALVWEGAVTLVDDMPAKDELRLEGAGTYTSGNPYHATAGNPGAAHPGKPAEQPEQFADATSWGYRLAGRFDYLNAIGAVNLTPRFAWQHDVNGVSPGPGGNFIEGRKALTVGLSFSYLDAWSGDVSYTRYFGAGRHNLIHDRDFVATNFKYSF